MSSELSRRGLFQLLGRTLRGSTGPASAASSSKEGQTAGAANKLEQVAVIQGRFCLAYTSVCSVCVEHCPVSGAIQVDKGIPVVVTETCTGCGVCREVCPAPTNAILVLPRRRVPRIPSMRENTAHNPE